MHARDRDVAAIEAIIADHERAYNTKDPALLASHYRERSWMVGVNGVELEGPTSLVAAAEAAFAGPLADDRARYRPGDVEFLADDVAICHMYATAVDEDGSAIDLDHAMIALYVFTRERGEWLVVARQNTLVPSPVDDRETSLT